MLRTSGAEGANRCVATRLSTVHTALFTVYFYWLTTYRTWRFDSSTYLDSFGGNFYWLQAKAILQGHLWLNTEGFECIILDGNCHGYFGPFPSLLRIPFVVLFGNRYESLSPVFMSLAAGTAFFALANLCLYITSRHPIHQSRLFDLIGLQVLLTGFGASSVLVLSAHPRVYEESVMWSVALTSVAINFSYRWFEERRNFQLGLVLLCGCCAVLSKPTSQPFFLILGAALLVLALKSRGWRPIAISVSIMLLPLALLATYSLANIGHIGFDATHWWPYNNILIVRNIIDHNSGTTIGLRFLPTVIVNHLRLNNLTYHLDWPFVSVAQDWYGKTIFVSPVGRKNMYAGYSPGLIAIVPGTALFGSIGALLLSSRKRKPLAANNFGLLIVTAAALGPAVMSMSYFAINARYLTDFYPFMSMILLAFSVHFFAKPAASRTKIAMIGIFSVFSVYSFVALASVQTDIVPWL